MDNSSKQFEKLQFIIQKLNQPGCAAIKSKLATSDYLPISNALILKPDLFLLLLDNPITFMAFLTPSSKDSFLKQISDTPEELIDILKPTPQIDLANPVQNTDGLNNIIGYIENYLVAYTPSLPNVRNTFSGFGENLLAALPSCNIANCFKIPADEESESNKQKLKKNQ